MSERADQPAGRVPETEERSPGAVTGIGGDVINSQVYTAGGDIIIYQGNQVPVTYWRGRPASQGAAFVERLLH